MIFGTTLISSSLGRVHGLSGGLPPGDFTTDFAYEILYHRMTISVSTEAQFSYDYAYGSGIYRPVGTGQTIDDANHLDGYIADLQGGAHDGKLPPLYNAHNAAPNVDVKVPCYIVLDPRGLQAFSYQPGLSGILIEPGKVSKYSGMYHYDTSLLRYKKTAPPQPSNDLCYIAVFGIKTPSGDNTSDNYSLTFEISQSSGNTITGEIDPRIKNRG